MNNVKENSPKILVAEDNNSNYLLFEYLLKHNYRIFHAHNGAEAVELFKLYHPQLILMDIKMPIMDGYEATAIIRELSSHTPIIAITAYAFAEDKEKIMKSGFSAYLAKPISSKELLNLIAKFLHPFPY